MKDLKKKTTKDLHKELDKKRKELLDLRFSASTGALRNPNKIKETKRAIARILTELNLRVKSSNEHE